MTTEDSSGLEGDLHRTAHYYLEGGSSVVEDARQTLLGRYSIRDWSTTHGREGSISQVDIEPPLTNKDRISIGAMAVKPQLH